MSQIQLNVKNYSKHLPLVSRIINNIQGKIFGMLEGQ